MSKWKGTPAPGKVELPSPPPPKAPPPRCVNCSAYLPRGTLTRFDTLDGADHKVGWGLCRAHPPPAGPTSLARGEDLTAFPLVVYDSWCREHVPAQT